MNRFQYVVILVVASIISFNACGSTGDKSGLLALLGLLGAGQPVEATPGLGYTPINGGTEYSVHAGVVTGGNVYIPANNPDNGIPVTVIEDDGFSGLAGLTSVIIADGITTIGSSAFLNCTGLTDVTIPDSVETIGANAFDGCNAMESITIPGSVLAIEADAFNSCTSLTNLIISEGVTTIGLHAFYGCTGLTGLTIPDSVVIVEGWAFAECSGLTSVMIGSGVASLADSTFDGCNDITDFNVDTDNAIYSSAGGVLLNKAASTLIRFPAGKTGSYSIPGTVTSIYTHAFIYTSGITTVTIPASIASIGNEAFNSCTSLTTVTVERDTPPSMGTNVFSLSIALSAIYVPAGTSGTYKTTAGWSDYSGIIFE